MDNQNNPRNGCKDIWNAFMVTGAEFSVGNDIPICPCVGTTFPKSLISYEKAKSLYKIEIKDGKPDFFCDAFIHFYEDDYKFDGRNIGIWHYPNKLLEIAKHFSGVVTPDFSTYVDFPDPIKRYNIYRMRAFDYWLVQNGIPVIQNVRWGTEETWSYCWDGIPQNSVVAIGTVASGLRKLINRPLFEDGLNEMVRVIHPSAIIVYGSANYPCFERLKKRGILIIAFPSETNLGFVGR